MIEINIDDAQLKDAINAAMSRMNDLTPAMRQIGEHVVETTERRFKTSTAPDGKRWEPNSPVTIARYLGGYSGMFKKRGGLTKKGAARAGGKKPLVGETRTLSTTINYRAGRDDVVIGSDRIQSAVMQFGARKGEFGRTRRDGPIPWGNIPARPFLGLSNADRRTVIEVLGRYIVRRGR